MTTLTVRSAWPTFKNIIIYALAFAAPIVLFYLGRELQQLNPSIGVLDFSIWQLVVVSIVSFMGLASLSWWLLKRAWAQLSLPAIEHMVLHFKELTLWQQFICY